MHLANSITKTLKGFFVLTAISVSFFNAAAQENSPYSRYAIGDLAPTQSIASRGMGSISAGVAEINNLNLNNPAALANVYFTTFDIGFDITNRKLISTSGTDKFRSVNTNISYFQLGVPLSSRKMIAKQTYWAMAFGIKPLSRINYKISQESRLIGIDTVNTMYEGNGGASQANISTGLKIKNFSLGLSSGYLFGSKDYSTKLRLYNNDSSLYERSLTSNNTSFGGVFFNAGIQYETKIKSRDTGNFYNVLRFGAVANFKRKLSAKREYLARTIFESGEGSVNSIDTVSYQPGLKGDVVLPAQYNVGFTYTTKNWLVGADLDFSTWADYRFYGAKENTINNMVVRTGVQYTPTARASNRNYWNNVRYRGGVYFGNDYIDLGQKRGIYGITAGAGFPITTRRSADFGMINAGVEFGGRGNKSSQSFRENVTRISLGLAINSQWFIKRRYD